MIEPATGNLLEARVDALVNPVNCVGVMGKGLALQFKARFPANFVLYERACQRGEAVPGRMFVTETLGGGARHVINFPTKRHWRDHSQFEDIEAGLVDLVRVVRNLGARSVAVPALGCGLGGLEWATVRPLIERAFAPVPDVQVLLYGPG